MNTDTITSVAPPNSEKSHAQCLSQLDGLGSQWVVLLTCWFFTLAYHSGNDGIWYQGDSPRHVMNSIFYMDLIAQGNNGLRQFSYEYYARYPAITPHRYPPFLYLVTATCFSLFGISCFIAKMVVQLFGLLLGSYTLLALRRWIAPQAGLVAGFVLLMPGCMTWSGAVMLNLPATALAVACLYHLRCYLEEPDAEDAPNQFCIAVIYGTLSVATHPVVGVVFPISLAWLVMDRRWRWLLSRRVQVVLAVSILVSVTLFGLLYSFSEQQFSQTGVTTARLAKSFWPVYYFEAVPELISWPLLITASLGIAHSLRDARYRRDGIRVLLASAVTLFMLSSIWAKDVRYMLWACPAATYFAAMAVVKIRDSRRFNCKPRFCASVSLICVASLFTYLGVVGWSSGLKSVNDFADVADFVVDASPNEPVLYHGVYDGSFVCYLRLQDERNRQQAILVRNLPLGLDKVWQVGASRMSRRGIRIKQPRSQLAPRKLLESLRETNCRLLILEQMKRHEADSICRAVEWLADAGEVKALRRLHINMRSSQIVITVYEIAEDAEIEPQPTIKPFPLKVGDKEYHPVLLSPSQFH
ncbi:MAG: hypothetical protein CMM01_07590 [Rhodopirellula sp.]|nr:hypothetical protein [Rhodopirellula sp.]